MKKISYNPGNRWKPSKGERRPATFEVCFVQDLTDISVSKRQADIIKLLKAEGFIQHGEVGGFEQWVRS